MAADKSLNNLAAGIRHTAFAFRGYNVTNLGRSKELLAHPAYASIVREYLREASRIASDTLGRRVHLVQRVRRGEETSIETYDEAIALIVAMELAQIELLRQFHGIEFKESLFSFGYSLGELAALSASGVFGLEQALETPLAMAKDVAELAHDTTLGVVFSRGPALAYEDVLRLCLRINNEGHGTIGISAILSPNTVLILGQGATVRRFKEMMHDLLPQRIHLRENDQTWPPMHTPITWQRNIPNRAAVMMQTLDGGFDPPQPPVVSLVTGATSYNDYNTRAMLQNWVDHPQRLWDAVYYTLSSDAETIIHVGPEPNLIPSTFKRLSENVQEQTTGKTWGSFGLRAVSRIARLQWLRNLLPSRTALLSAPQLQHVILEDWLLENSPTQPAAQ